MVAIVLTMFVAGIGMVGVSPQCVWLITSNTPILESGLETARRIQSKNNLKQVILALNQYAELHGSLPAGGMNGFGEMRHGWMAQLLPFVEQDSLCEALDFSRAWDHPPNETVYSTKVNGFQFAADWERTHASGSPPGYAFTDYAANVHVIGGTRARRLKEVSDGAANTILAGEAVTNAKPWGHPANWRDPSKGINACADGFGASWANGSAQFIMVDGSARTIPEDVDPQVLQALSTPNGGEPIGANE